MAKTEVQFIKSFGNAGGVILAGTTGTVEGVRSGAGGTWMIKVNVATIWVETSPSPVSQIVEVPDDVLVILLTGGGGGGPPGEGRSPVVLNLNPQGAQAGSPPFMLRVLGEFFLPESLILWAAAPLTTTYVSDTELTAMVDLSAAAPLGAPVKVDVQVQTGSLISNARKFTIEGVVVNGPPVPPVLSGLVPDRATLGSPSFTIHVMGGPFTPESTILWNGSEEATVFVSDSELTTGVNMATAEVAITIGVEVKTGELVSNTLPFMFEAPVAR